MTVQRLVPRNVVDQYLELSPRKALHHFPRSAFANVMLDVAECIEAGPSTRDPDLDKRREEAIAEHAAELLSPGRKRIYEKGADMRSTGWFIESLATQCLVSFIIRTRGAPWPVLWLFNVVGLLDLAYANISSLAAGSRSRSMGRFLLPCSSQCAGHGGRSRAHLCLFAAGRATKWSTNTVGV